MHHYHLHSRLIATRRWMHIRTYCCRSLSANDDGNDNDCDDDFDRSERGLIGGQEDAYEYHYFRHRLCDNSSHDVKNLHTLTMTPVSSIFRSLPPKTTQVHEWSVPG